MLGALFYGYEYSLRIMPSLVMPQLMAHFSLNHTGFGYLAATYYYAYVLFQVPAGILIDRFGAIRLLMLACFACTLGQLLFATTNYIYLALLARFVIGVGSVFAFVGTLSIVNVFLPSHYFPVLVGLTSAFGTISAMVSDVSLSFTLQKLGWAQTNFALIIFGFVLSSLLFMIYFKSNESKITSENAVGLRELLKNSRGFLQDKRFWINALTGCLIYFPTTIFAELWGIPYLQAVRDYSESQAAFAISCLFLGFTVGAPSAGYLANKFDRFNILIMGSMLASVLSMVILYSSWHSMHFTLILMFALGFSYAAQVLIFSVAKDLVPVNLSASILAFTNMVVMLGGLFFQPIVGHIIDFINYEQSSHHEVVLHSYQCALLVLPIGLIVSLLLSIFQKRNFSKD